MCVINELQKIRRRVGKKQGKISIREFHKINKVRKPFEQLLQELEAYSKKTRKRKANS